MTLFFLLFLNSTCAHYDITIHRQREREAKRAAKGKKGKSTKKKTAKKVTKKSAAKKNERKMMTIV